MLGWWTWGVARASRRSSWRANSRRRTWSASTSRRACCPRPDAGAAAWAVSERASTWLQADAARLPLAEGSVDACTGHSFLYLVADRSAVLAEARRVLRPGGQLVLMEPSARGASPAGVLRVSHDVRHLVSVSLWRPFSLLHGRFTPGLAQPRPWHVPASSTAGSKKRSAGSACWSSATRP